MTISEKSKSLGDMFHQSCKQHSDRTAALVREKAEFRAMSYAAVHESVREFASGLMAVGLKRGDIVAIIGESCIEWAHTDWAAQTLGVITVPIYPTLTTEQTQYILNDCHATSAIIGSKSLMEKVQSISVYSWSKFDGVETIQERGRKSLINELDWISMCDAVQRDDVATIIYTSGTTGEPKGAVLPHRCFLSLTDGIHQSLPVSESDTFLSFLPLSHVFERFAGHVLPVSLGAAIGYSGGSLTLGKDMLAVRPTIMLLVPRVLEAIRDRILDGVRKQSKLRQWLFRAALQQGLRRNQGKFAPLAPLLDKLVGSKIRSHTGGRIRFFVSGGAPLAPSVAEFYMAFGLTVLQGYGLTETMAATAVNHPDRNDPETVGEVIQGMEVKIADDGEILIRGPGVMDGYLNLPEDTASAIDPEGWFHSGDIGTYEKGRLKITDRKKDLLVLANGKNVAPQPIENRLKLSDFIAEAVLFGDHMDSVCALIVPKYERIRSVLGQNMTLPESDSELICIKQVQDLIKSEIARVNRDLAVYERITRHELLGANFSEATGELTPTLKVKRKFVREKYAALLDKMKR